MAILSTGNTYAANDQVTSSNLNAAINSSTFASGAVDNSSTQLSGGAIIVKDAGVTASKLESASNGQLFIGNGSGFTKATLTAGSNITITNSSGGITIAAAGTGGTVTSVALSGGTTGLTSSGGPITTSGTITLAGTLAVANGGTGATSAPNARTNLGATTVGNNLFTLGNPGAVRFLRLNADNSVSALSDSDFRTAIGVGSGSGTIVGSTGSVDNKIIRADGTGGLTIQNSAVSIDDSGNVNGVGTLSTTGDIGTSGSISASGNISASGSVDVGTTGYKVSGTKVLGVQQAYINTVGLSGSYGSDVTYIEDAINEIINAMRSHGLIVP